MVKFIDKYYAFFFTYSQYKYPLPLPSWKASDAQTGVWIMLVNYLAAYYPQSAHAKVTPRTSLHWESYKFCKAVKSGEFGEGVAFPWKDSTETIEAGDVGRVRTIFGLFVKRKIFDRGIRKPVIIPIPSKDGTFERRDFRTYQMAREAMQGDLAYPVVPALRFTERMAPSSLGGPRNVSTLYKYMDVIGQVPEGDIILLDDILTTGVSMRAAYKRLTEANLRVVGAVVCGRTVYRADVLAFGDRQVRCSMSAVDEDIRRLENPIWQWL